MTIAPRATVEQLRKARTKTVTVRVDGEPMSFVISKIKGGQRKRIREECVDAYGIVDTDAVEALAVELCTVEPALTADDVAELDADVLAELAGYITDHSNLKTITQIATPDPEEGSDAVKGFPAADGEAGVGGGVDADQPRA